MKLLTGLCVAIGAFFSMTGGSYAESIDLGAFTADEWVSIDNGTVTFTEDMTYLRGYLQNESFFVAEDAAFLCFDYSLTYGPDDYDDYFVCEMESVPVLQVFSPSSGRARIDLSPYRGRIVPLAWGLLWGGNDSAAGTVARISSIDLEFQNQGTNVPLPGSIVFMLSGITVLFAVRRQGRV